MLLNVLIRIGTTLLLVDNYQSSRCNYGEALSCLTLVIISLEKYGETENIDLANLDQYAATKRVLLNPKGISIRRDLLKFYRKRVSCKCLKKLHLNARKTLPKMGICFGCGKDKDRASLSVCSRCLVSGFCSRECQVAHSTEHRQHCDNFVKVREQTK